MQTLDPSTRYERGPRLGSGAMGEVWGVYDRARGVDVAMKTLHGVTDGARFEREIALQSRLSHRAVPRVLDRGYDETGTPWFTMERVEGRTLAAILDEVRACRETDGARTMRAAWLLRAFVRLCRAVEHAHGRGVVHRDLKPENVMVDARGEVHLLDWGLAALAGERPDDPRGLVVGTPGYIAPELARGDGKAAHASGDVYALGAILFELVHLEPLFPQAHPLARLTAALLEGDPLAGRAAPQGGRSAALESVIRCAVAREPAARFASAEALALAVERTLAPAAASAPTRPPGKLGLVAAAALGLLALWPVAAKAERALDAAEDGARALAGALASRGAP